jgi:murein DD-endopeptidase MepM/ murein hydrolase activator NlpD
MRNSVGMTPSPPLASIVVLVVLAGAGSARAANVITGVPPDSEGGGPAPVSVADDITAEQRSAIQAQIDTNVRALPRRAPAPLVATQFGWPLQPAFGFTDYGYHGISNFVDQNLAYPNAILDYHCGARTYDLASGYNHGGTDIFIWPFAWNKMDAGEITIVAAAPGMIVYKTDGNFDRSCGLNSNDWNAVYVQHADGSVAWYGHMKSGSPTSKGVGASVSQGEYLGTVGSSGSSTGPHLHFEVHDASSKLIDPFDGPCNSFNPSVSWWATQPAYYDSAVNEIATATAPPGFPTCPMPETSNGSDVFLPGNTIVFVGYYRDQLSSQIEQHTIYRPDSSVYSSWTHSSPAAYYAASYWYWTFANFAPSGPLGTYRYEIVFNGHTYTHDFNVGTALCTPESCEDGDACTVDSCDPSVGCSRSTPDGLAGIACRCDDTPAECAGQTIVTKVQKKLSSACATLAGVDSASNERKRARLIRNAIRRLNRAGKSAVAATHRRRPKLSSACGVALQALFQEIAGRAGAL